MIDYEALKAEIESKPDLYGGKSHSEVAETLNQKVGGQSGYYMLGSMPVGDFLLALAPGIAALHAKPDNLQRHYDRLLNIISNQQAVRIGDGRISGILAQAVSDGLMSQSDIDAIGRVHGSRAEAMFGKGAVVLPHDVRKALVGGDV